MSKVLRVNLKDGNSINTIFEQIPFCIKLYIKNQYIESEPMEEDIYSVCVKALGDLVIKEESDVEVKKEVATLPSQTFGKCTSNNGLNIREKASIESNIVGVLDFGQRFHIVGISEDGNWLEIDRPCNGWIDKEYTLLSDTPNTFSIDLLSFTKSWEGFSATPYQDAGGNWTIGFGICSYQDKPNFTMTETEASVQLANTLNELAQQICNIVGYLNLSQSEMDALIDFTYNLGLGALKNSTLLKKIIACENNNVITHDFEEWSYCDNRQLEGLLRRRRAEAEMFLYGKYNNN